MLKIFLYAILLFFSSMYWFLAGIPVYQCLGYAGFATTAADTALRQPWMLGGMFFLGAVIILFIFVKHHSETGAIRGWAFISLFFLYLNIGLLGYQVVNFHQQAALSTGLAAAITGFLTLFFIYMFFAKNLKPWMLFAGGVMSYLLILFLRMAMPMDLFSDSLPLIQKAGKSFLTGLSPYGMQYFPTGDVRTSYLPGMWLSFLPATGLNFDLRIINMLCLLAFAGFSYLTWGKEQKLYGAALISLFIMNPWLGFRHDHYIGVYIWALAFFAYSLSLGKNKLAAAAFGWSAAVYQFSWFLWPIWLTWEYKRSGFKHALRAALISGAVAGCVVLPFLIYDSSGFFKGVFGTWSKNVMADHYNLIHWLPEIMLRPIQLLACLGGVLFILYRPASQAELFKTSALALAVFTVANTYVANYFFFIFLALFYFYEAARIREPKISGENK